MNELDDWLEHNAIIDAAVFFDREKQKFCANAYIDGQGAILEAFGETALEATQNWDKEHEKSFRK